MAAHEMSGATETGGDRSLDPGGFSPRHAHQQRPAQAFPCPPVVAVALAVIALAGVLDAAAAGGARPSTRIAGGVVAVAIALIGPGFLVVQPNESRVLILFGRYIGTLTEARLWWA